MFRTKERKYFEEVMIEKHGPSVDFSRDAKGNYMNSSLQSQWVSYLLYRLNNPKEFK